MSTKKPMNFVPAKPKEGQEEYYDALQKYPVTFVMGDAGTGKSFLAINQAIKELNNKKSSINKICVIRPYIFSTSEKIGSLPGDLDEKIRPFTEAIRDNLEELIHDKRIVNEILNNHVEVFALSTLRGRSLHNAYIICEETQNISLKDDGILLILTRIGRNSKIVFTGDTSQADIYPSDMAIYEAMNALKGIDKIKFLQLSGIKQNYRNHLIGEVIGAFNNFRKGNI